MVFIFWLLFYTHTDSLQYILRNYCFRAN